MDNNEKKSLNDKQFDSTIKSLIQRDYFPLLSKSEKEQDRSTKKYSVSKFCNSFTPESDANFLKTVERDRLILRNSAPSAKIDKHLENDKNNPYGRQPYSALFYEPQTANKVHQLCIEYKNDRKPTINPQNTRLTTNRNQENTQITNYHMFTTESSSTESESDFEGRSSYRKELIQSFRTPVKVNTEKIKKRTISDKGLSLLAQFK